MCCRQPCKILVRARTGSLVMLLRCTTLFTGSRFMNGSRVFGAKADSSAFSAVLADFSSCRRTRCSQVSACWPHA